MKNLIKWTRWEFSFGNTRVWPFIFLICTRFSWSIECLVFVEGGKIEELKTLNSSWLHSFILGSSLYSSYTSIIPLPPSFCSWSFLSSFHIFLPNLCSLFYSLLSPPPPPPTHTFFYFTSLPLLSEETNWISLYIPVTVSLLNQ